MSGRSQLRAEITDDHTRILLLEQDADKQDTTTAAVVSRLDEELTNLRRILIGLLVTIAASAVGTCLTLVVTR